jgi:hypothetical protein
VGLCKALSHLSPSPENNFHDHPNGMLASAPRARSVVVTTRIRQLRWQINIVLERDNSEAP